jgi:hypothetical protein
MFGDGGIAMTLTKCHACGATMHILMEAERNITAKYRQSTTKMHVLMDCIAHRQ